MDYYGGLEFSLGGSQPRCTDWYRHVPIYYGIQYNHAGILRLRVDRKAEYEMRGPCAFISHPGAFIEYGTADGKPRHHNFVCFFGPRIEAYKTGGLLRLPSPKPLVRIADGIRFHGALQALCEAIHGRRRLSSARRVVALEELLLQFRENEAGETAGHPPGPLTELLFAVEAAPERAWDFRGAASRFGWTEPHFRRVFKARAGMAPQQYVIQLRLRRASRLLVETSEPILAIAQRMGIENGFYFSRLFKERFGLSPLQYRNEFRAATKPPG
ncbi:MAG: AraC family transcriptional regulator [Spirochaetes bacterium]|nr:AraC family transcriptional regulator [Spirochaetota bacterium]